MELAELAQNKVYGRLLCALSLTFRLPKREEFFESQVKLH